MYIYYIYIIYIYIHRSNRKYLDDYGKKIVLYCKQRTLLVLPSVLVVDDIPN